MNKTKHHTNALVSSISDRNPNGNGLAEDFDSRGCAKKGCLKSGQRRWGQVVYCDKCYRFTQMRKSAKERGKYKPSWEELEALLAETNGMICKHCGCKMSWRQDQHGSRQITLQHGDDGKIELICFGCNIAHGATKMPNKNHVLYLRRSRKKKWCSDCKTFCPTSNFYFYASAWDRLGFICKDCQKRRFREWYLKKHPNAKTRGPRKKNVIEIRAEESTRDNFTQRLKLA